LQPPVPWREWKLGQDIAGLLNTDGQVHGADEDKFGSSVVLDDGKESKVPVDQKGWRGGSTDEMGKRPDQKENNPKK
jgi:hypothetical protein